MFVLNCVFVAVYSDTVQTEEVMCRLYFASLLCLLTD